VSFLVLCVAAVALVAATGSLLAGAGLSAGRRWLESRSPSARARVLWFAAVLPAAVTTVVMLAALAPWLGWIADHCDIALDPHGHPHICDHHTGALPAASVLIVAALFVARAAWRLGGLLAVQLRAKRIVSDLLRTAARHDDGVFVLPMSEPKAFVTGLLRPKLFVTRGLLHGSPAHVRIIRAHEEAHASRRDLLWRFTAAIGCAFHLPIIGDRILRALGVAQEMAADLVAADRVGSRTAVAEALVFAARQSMSMPAATLGFGATEIEARVRALLADEDGADAPGFPLLLATLAAIVSVVALSPDLVHHGVELLLGVLAT